MISYKYKSGFAPRVVEDLRDGYVEIVRDVLAYGREREARGYVARDVADACFTVLDTRALLPLGVGRDINPQIGYAEALLFCGGVESPSLAVSASKAFRRFFDGGALAGSYGPLTRSQMPHVVDVLRGDPDSRQAVVQVHPGLQNVLGLADVPCTINLGFELRDDGLHVRATMRSNDVWLGLAYDAFQFGQVGWTLANVLGVELVSYTHHAYSLHIYERDWDKVEGLHESRLNNFSYDPTGFGRDEDTTWEAARRRAIQVYENCRPVGATVSEDTYLSVLGDLHRETRVANFTS